MRDITRKLLCQGMTVALCATVGLSACSKKQDAEPAQQEQQTEAQNDDQGSTEGKDESQSSMESTDATKKLADGRLDPLVLVNKEYALPDGWEEKIELESATNAKGDTVSVDKIAFDAFSDLQKDLEENEGITIQLNSGYRSIADQQQIFNELKESEGEAYVNKYVAVPGHSEHHTGLALDALLVENGEPIVTNEDIFARQDTWDIIHSHLARHGFILRYLDGQEEITGYTYEPWHIRYVGQEDAEKIMASGVTLEEYLGKKPSTPQYSGSDDEQTEQTGTDDQNVEYDEYDDSSYDESYTATDGSDEYSYSNDQ